MAKAKNPDKVLTVQVHHENLNPRTFKVPLRWIQNASVMAWFLLGISIFSSVFAIREYLSERSARPELVSELENEVQELKIALEKKGTTAGPVAPSVPTQTDPKATNEKPVPATGEAVDAKPGVWSGLADNITVPPPGQTPPLRIEDARLEWQGKYANFNASILFRDPGKGSQQGHIVALGRANDRLYSHPEGVLNTSAGAALFDPNRGEYFSVSRYRVFKAHFGPFDSTKQLTEIQLFVFDLNNRLIVNQVFHYGK